MGTSKNHEAVVRQFEDVKLHSPILITGFVGAGLVGSIAAAHIIEQLNMKEIAYLKSKHIPPAAVFEGGRLRHPFRIHVSKDGQICVAICEVPLKLNGLYFIASSLLDWAEEKGINEVVVIDGIKVKGLPPEHRVFCAAEEKKCKALKEKGVEILQKGFIIGIGGSVLNECLIRKVNGVVFLVTASAYMPDPEGAAKLIETLNKVYGLNIDVDKLKSQAEKIKQRFEETIKQYKQTMQPESKKDVQEQFYA